MYKYSISLRRRDSADTLSRNSTEPNILRLFLIPFLNNPHTKSDINHQEYLW